MGVLLDRQAGQLIEFLEQLRDECADIPTREEAAQFLSLVQGMKDGIDTLTHGVVSVEHFILGDAKAPVVVQTIEGPRIEYRRRGQI